MAPGINRKRTRITSFLLHAPGVCKTGGIPALLLRPTVKVIKLSLRRSKNDAFGVGVEIAIEIETHAMALFVDFDSDPDIDFDDFSQGEKSLS